jgi:hypothetical protein
MLRAFSRNYEDNSTDAGFQFTFCCDICRDGHRSSFIESATYKKKKGSILFGQGASIAGSLLGGQLRKVGTAASQGGKILSERFNDKSPEWQKEHEWAFERAQNEAKRYFHRCPNDNKYVCDHCWNEDEGLCVSCSPRQEVYVAQTRAQAMKRNIDQAGQTATVWQGNIESKTTTCPSCGKPAGTGAFCSNCGAGMALKECSKCGTKNALTVRFCCGCGAKIEAPAPPPAPQAGRCPSCGEQNTPGARFCNGCGQNLQSLAQAAPQAGRCPSCGEQNAPGVRFCNGCGAKIGAPPAPPADGAACPSCGAPAPAGTKFCQECGAKIG